MAPADIVEVKGIDRLLDVEQCRRRLNEALQSEALDEQQKSTIGRLLAAWDGEM